jgi:cytochrome c-type biogenesis protein CcmH/NrfG
MNRADQRRQGASRETRHQTTVQAWLNQGRIHQQAGRLVEAEDAYRHALELAPRDAESFHLLGLVTYRLNRLAESLRYLHAAVEQQPSSSVYWFNLGVVSQKAGRSSDAVTAYE